MRQLDVLVLARLFVLREGGSATRAPLRRTMTLVQPVSRVALLEEAPDVLDVRVGKRVVVVVPVHPHAEAPRLVGDHLGVVGDPLFAALGELGQPVRLNVSLRPEPQRLLDLDLDPESLRVKAVLVALVEAPEGLVALEDVLEGAAPGMVNSHRVVRRDGPVHEAELRAAAVPLAQLFEDALPVPPGEDLLLEGRMIRVLGERLEHPLRF